MSLFKLAPKLHLKLVSVAATWVTVKMYRHTHTTLVNFAHTNGVTFPEGLDLLWQTLLDLTDEVRELKLEVKNLEAKLKTCQQNCK